MLEALLGLAATLVICTAVADRRAVKSLGRRERSAAEQPKRQLTQLESEPLHQLRRQIAAHKVDEWWDVPVDFNYDEILQEVLGEIDPRVERKSYPAKRAHWDYHVADLSQRPQASWNLN